MADVRSKKIKILVGRAISDLERAYDKLHAWFYAYPSKEFSLNDLIENLGMSKTTAAVVVSQLAKEGFIHISRIGKTWRIKANPLHPHFVTKKIPFNLRLVYESGIIDWIKSNIPNARTVILFGSYRKGDDIESSDLDVAVEVIGKDPLKILPGLTIKKFGYREHVNVNVHIFSRSNVDLNLFANIANGFVLDGFLEVKP